MKSKVGQLLAVASLVVVVALAGGGSVGAAPSNDNFANAAVLTAGGGSLATDNTGATKEAGEPDSAGDQGGASLWYRWTPDFSGYASIDTSGSTVDTLLSAYTNTGASFSTLNFVASNDDALSSTTSSRICFPVLANAATYLISVDGYDGDAGPIALNWGPKTDSAPCPMLPGGVSPSQPKVGDHLAFSPANFAVPGAGSETFQWFRCVEEECIAIDGATDGGYTVTPRDVGTVIRVDSEITNASGTALNTSDPTGVVATMPQTHANGRIFWAGDFGNSGAALGVRSMFADTSNESTIVSTGSIVVNPAPSPDGTQVAYVAAPNDIRVMNADGSGDFDLGVAGFDPTWSPDGSRIAFLGSSGIEVVDLDDLSNVVRLVPFPRSGPPGGLSNIDWSPDGTKLVFSYAPPGQTGGIAVARADGRGSVTQLTTPNGILDDFPAWSPDGTRIAFDRFTNCCPGDGNVYVMNADGTNQTLLFDGDANHIAEEGLDWSPDGTSIVFSRVDNGSSSELFTIPAAGGSATRLTFNSHRDDRPAWAPLASFELDVSRSGSGSGTVTSSTGGISCGSSCSAVFVDPASVALTAKAAAGSTFGGWTGDCSGTGVCTVSMSGPHTVGAVFNAASSSGGGAGGGGGGGGGGGSSSLALSVSPSSQTVASGAAANWTISVTNAGGAYLYAVGVRDAIAPGCGIPSSFADTASLMAPGVTISYGCSLSNVTSSLTNTVVATATTGPGDVLTQTATATVTVQAPPAAPTPSGGGTTTAPRAPSSIHRVTGTSRADRLIGTAAADVINGLGGSDSINGGKGNDTLNGGAGNDTITGGPGRDTIAGGSGRDLISARDHARDSINCGSGRDLVYADKGDRVARNCEVVQR
jgi:Tol biopolymer transport system component